MSVEAIKKNLKRKQDFINDIVVIDNFPLFNWIELNINEVCNRRCVFCPRSQGYPQENIHMEVSQAEFIASEVKDLGFRGIVNISGTGEPLLTKHIHEIVKEFSDRGIKIEITTNGDKLKPKIIKRLYDAGLNQLVISMYDGPEQISHFKNLLTKECGIDPSLYSLRDRWYSEDEGFGLMYTNRSGSLENKNIHYKDNPCYYPSYTILLDLNGDVLLCPHDVFNKTVTFGNINKTPIFELWKSKKLMEYRQNLIKGNRCLTPCESCNAQGTLLGGEHAKLWS
tara:strand:- start:1015 stop:1860 length:846 start_codon:yes stop_codon:yes gene_type:complete